MICKNPMCNVRLTKQQISRKTVYCCPTCRADAKKNTPPAWGGNRPGGERDKAKHDTKTATKAVRLGLIHKEAAWMKAAEEDYRAWKSKFKSSIP